MTEWEKLIVRVKEVDLNNSLDVAQLNKDLAIFFGKIPKSVPNYLTSRDCLKYNRPEGWGFAAIVTQDSARFCYIKRQIEKIEIEHNDLTEEKAELCCLIEIKGRYGKK